MVDMVAKQTSVTFSPQREAARALAELSCRPMGLVLWLKFSNEYPNLLFTDCACMSVPTIRGNPLSYASFEILLDLQASKAPLRLAGKVKAAWRNGRSINSRTKTESIVVW